MSRDTGPGRSIAVGSCLLVVAFLAAGCTPPDIPRAKDAEMPRPIRDGGTGTTIGGGGDGATRGAAPGATAKAADAAGETRPLVVYLGDSLTAGYGLGQDEAYPARVEELLAQRSLQIRTVNAGVSGDTTAGGRERLDWLLRLDPEILVVELGGNDGLRGQPIESTEANLRDILERAGRAGVRVLLVGMKLPPNFGPEYTSEFEAIYPRLAREHEVALLPFLLEGVAADPELNQPDGIHPNARGQALVARTVAAALEPLLTTARPAREPS